MSRLRGGWLAQSTFETIDEAVAAGAAQMWTGRASERIVRAVPQGHPADHPELRSQICETVSRSAVALLPGGRVLGRHRAVITAGGGLVAELSPYFGTRRALEHPVFLHPFPGKPLEVSGSLGVIATRGDHSYYHFMIDALPRLAVLSGCPGAPQADLLYVPHQLRFQRELLALLGLPAAQIVDSVLSPHVRAERLVVPTLPDPDLRTPPWIVEYLRRRLLPAVGEAAGEERIYVTRGSRRNTRIVLNEHDVVTLLRERGFVVVDPGKMSVDQQIRTFAAARLIVAPHGGALTNLAFVGAGASLVELFAPDFVQGCYWKLLSAVPETRYRFLIGEGPSDGGAMQGVATDIEVDLRVLARLVDDIARD